MAATLAVLAVLAAGAGAIELAEAWPARRARTRCSPLVGILLRWGRRVGAPAAPAGMERRLHAAGSPLGLGVREVMWVKAGAAIAGFVAVAPWSAALPGRLPVLGLAAAPLAGFLAPDVLLARAARARERAMSSELADVLDLLRVCVAAGMPASRGLAEVGRRHAGVLGRELRRTGAEIGLGVPADVALDRLVARCPADGVADLVGAVRRAERSGAPLRGVLAAQALEARAREARRIADAAARAGPKMQLVVALLLVPSVMLLVAAALVGGLTGEVRAL